MSHRFFLDSEVRDGRTILDGDQAHHAIHVMRSKVGDEVVLFDGKGTEHTALVVAAAKKKLHLEITSSRAIDRTARREVTIAVALPKGDRQKFLVEKLVELGVSRLVPLKTTRSVAVATVNVIDRLNRHVIEASKQCGRNYLMSVDHEHTLQQLIGSTPPDVSRFVANPTGEIDITIADHNQSTAAIIAVGPEGGFTDRELQEFEAAEWKSVKLGPTILRIETAAIVAAVLLAMNPADP
jgi:16S rRNA (uracil1498-N3)-methyltransferase